MKYTVKEFTHLSW